MVHSFQPRGQNSAENPKIMHTRRDQRPRDAHVDRLRRRRLHGERRHVTRQGAFFPTLGPKFCEEFENDLQKLHTRRHERLHDDHIDQHHRRRCVDGARVTVNVQFNTMLYVDSQVKISRTIRK